MLEKLYEKRLVSFVDSNNILNESQYGFRKNRSTDTALLQLVEQISTAIDHKLCTVGIFVDLKKAFDTLNASVLLSKLEHVGVRGIAHQWLKSYLTNRKQFVYVKENSSNYSNVIHGVPQGSILGPILFLIYINDIVNVSDNVDFILFADDTNLFKSGNKLANVCDELCQELRKLHTWFNINKLSLNIAKTNYIVFGNKSTEQDSFIQINGVEIERVQCTKFLGVEVDAKLTWTQHVNKVANKVTRSLSIMYRVKDFITRTALTTLYSSFVLPYLSYAIEVWGNTYRSNLKRLVILQKRCIRLLCGKSKWFESSVLFRELKLLKLFDLVKMKTLLFMFRAYNKQLPYNLQKLFALGNNNCNVITRQQNCFRVCYSRTTLRQHSIGYVGPRLWNALPVEVISCSSLSMFKRSLKNRFIKSY